MAIPEEELFYLSQKAGKPYFEAELKFYTDAIKEGLDNITQEYNIEFNKDDVKIYVQGSYKNNTMTDDFSKLEIVVEFPQNIFGNILKQPILKTKRILFEDSIVKKRIIKFKPIVPLNILKKVIMETVLNISKNNGIFNNSKSISIPATKKHKISCEILPCYTLNNTENHSVIIYDSLINKYVAAFPVLHCQNLRLKDEKTNGNFLNIVRIFRNIRDIMIENEIINEGFAPSYFIECLLYNIPNSLLTGTLERSMLKTLNYLKNCNLNRFVCAHEQFQMFGNNSDTWTTLKARSFIEVLIDIWQDFDKEEDEI